MKYIYTTLLLFCGIYLQAQTPRFTLFLSTRNEYVNIYGGAAGNDIIEKVIENMAIDDSNTILVKGQSSLRFYVDIYPSITSNDVITGWINKTDCAAYVRIRSEQWLLYEEPSENACQIIFDAKKISDSDPHLYVIDYLVEPNSGPYPEYPAPEWYKVGFTYNGVYYEGWINEICTDINHSCN